MKHLIVLLCVFMIYATTYAQNIVQAEYFINNDPGFGNGTPIPVNPGVDVTLNFHVNTDGLENGLHELFIRAKDENGAWSTVVGRPFMLGNYPTDPLLSLVRAEYFIDVDPGHGLGTELPITPGTTVEIDAMIPLVNVSHGLHILYFRTKNESGHWSQTYARPFIKLLAPDDPVSITLLEYFIDDDPGVGNGISVEITPGSQIEQSFIIYPGSMPVGEHTLYARAKDDRGVWSTVFSQSFEVLESEPVQVTFIIEDSDENPITDAIITFNGISYDPGHYDIGTFDPASYSYEVQKEGYFSVTEQVELFTDTLITIILEKDITGIYSVHGQNTRVFPNPASSKINIESPLLIERIVVTDLSGRIFYTKEINEYTAALSLSGLESGIYFIHLETPLGVFNEKIVIQK